MISGSGEKRAPAKVQASAQALDADTGGSLCILKKNNLSGRERILKQNDGSIKRNHTNCHSIEKCGIS